MPSSNPSLMTAETADTFHSRRRYKAFRSSLPHAENVWKRAVHSATDWPSFKSFRSQHHRLILTSRTVLFQRCVSSSNDRRRLWRTVNRYHAGDFLHTHVAHSFYGRLKVVGVSDFLRRIKLQHVGKFQKRRFTDVRESVARINKINSRNIMICRSRCPFSSVRGTNGFQQDQNTIPSH